VQAQAAVSQAVAGGQGGAGRARQRQEQEAASHSCRLLLEQASFSGARPGRQEQEQLSACSRWRGAGQDDRRHSHLGVFSRQQWTKETPDKLRKLQRARDNQSKMLADQPGMSDSHL
jgi:hypothetical protein